MGQRSVVRKEVPNGEARIREAVRVRDCYHGGFAREYVGLLL